MKRARKFFIALIVCVCLLVLVWIIPITYFFFEYCLGKIPRRSTTSSPTPEAFPLSTEMV
jgi:uncharacterized RDD family membrane protein YckC